VRHSCQPAHKNTVRAAFATRTALAQQKGRVRRRLVVSRIRPGSASRAMRCRAKGRHRRSAARTLGKRPSRTRAIIILHDGSLLQRLAGTRGVARGYVVGETCAAERVFPVGVPWHRSVPSSPRCSSAAEPIRDPVGPEPDACSKYNTRGAPVFPLESAIARDNGLSRPDALRYRRGAWQSPRVSAARTRARVSSP